MWRVVDIAEADRHLHLSRQSLVVSDKGQELGRIPVSDIQAVLVHGFGASLSLNVAAALAEAGIPLVLCGANHLPALLCLPVSANFEQAARTNAQAEASLPLKKRLWQSLIRAKITAQARCLEESDSQGHSSLIKLAKKVRAGDPDNLEAQAARAYWPRLMGPDFRRDQDADGLNAHLNYGYAVLRAAVARAVVGAGLSPALGLHHRGRLNPFQLVDDLMEPFRPLVDLLVWRNRTEWTGRLAPDAKRSLAGWITASLPTDQGAQPLTRVMSQLAVGLAQVYMGEEKQLWLPDDWALLRQEELDLG
ncbi:MAG: type II CRISPR-associated endonuclease Cas1 [Magnetovibrionaceae bacterium]